MGAVHTIVKSRDLYVNSIRKVGKDGMEVTEEFAQKIVELVLKFKEKARNDHLNHMSTTVVENMEREAEIEIQEKRMVSLDRDHKGEAGVKGSPLLVLC